METQEATQQPWLVMENGRILYAHVIGLKTFTCPVKANKTAKAN